MTLLMKNRTTTVIHVQGKHNHSNLDEHNKQWPDTLMRHVSETSGLTGLDDTLRCSQWKIHQSMLLAQDLLVELANTRLLQFVYKANIRHGPFGDGSLVYPCLNMDLELLFGDRAHTLLLQHDQGQTA